MAIAIIPARGGSKGIPRKNLLKILDKTLVSWSVEFALSCPSISDVFVSTEDSTIADEAIKSGANIIERPNELASDEALDLPVFHHAIQYLREIGHNPDILVHLRPTAPLRSVDDLERAIKLLNENSEADSIRSVSPVSQHPYRVFNINESGYLRSIYSETIPDSFILRRQELPENYYYNCVLDVTRSSTVEIKQSMTGDKMLPLVMKAEGPLDIDTLMDFELLKFIMEKRS